jgi:hypothetical protein
MRLYLCVQTTLRGLRCIGKLFLAFLAVADLFESGRVMTFTVVNDPLGHWIFGVQFSDTWIASDVICPVLASMDRYRQESTL